MPWQEACVQEQRMRFIHDWQKQQDSMAELCRRYGISRRVGYKWLERYRQEGIEGLQDQSRAPRRHPNQTPAALEERIVALRARHGRWGPTTLKAVLERKDAAVTWPARSTIGQLLKRQGLSLPRRRRPRAAPTRPPLTPMGEPNQVWSIDFKGWFRTQDGERCDPLTISDGASRYLLRCQGLRHPDGEHVRALMEAAFREYGLPRVLRSDNGPPFATVAVHGLSSLAVWWIKLGICPERIEPGHPEQNGRHERMHRTLKQETASPPARTLRAQQRAFDRFRREYNEERPHQGLELKTPGECYGLSPRPYPSRIEEPVYPAEFALRRVVDGVIRWRRQKVFVGKGLNGERVGLEQIGERLWRVWFSFYELGWLDERQGRLSPPGPEGAGARPRRAPDSGRPAGSLRPAPSSDEKCYLCAWHKVLPMSGLLTGGDGESVFLGRRPAFQIAPGQLCRPCTVGVVQREPIPRSRWPGYRASPLFSRGFGGQRWTNDICRGGPPCPPAREIHTASHSMTRPNPAKTPLGRRSGLPLQFCREK